MAFIVKSLAMSVMMMENLGHLLIEFVQNIFHIVKRFARYKETKFLYFDLWPIKLWSQYHYSHHFLWGTSVPYVLCLPNKEFPGHWADILTNKPTGSRKLTNKSTRNISRIQAFNYKDQCLVNLESSCTCIYTGTINLSG